MRLAKALLVVGLLAATACGGDDAGSDGPAAAGAEEQATAFEWETVLDQDGYGYVLTVEGTVGEASATYTMQVEPTFGEQGGDYADVLATLAGTAVNGFAEDGAGVGPGGEIDPDGQTRVVVLGDDRWYRSPWLLDEAVTAMGDAEWVHVPAGEPVIADAVTAVLNERYDDALRRLLASVRDGSPIEAPTPEDSGAELDEVLTPWIGLVGPAYPMGSPATVTGDAAQGEATWRDELTYDPDGADGELRGTIRWRPATAVPPTPPASSIDVAELTAGLGG